MSMHLKNKLGLDWANEKYIRNLYQDLEARRTHLADHDGLGGREGGRAVDSLQTAEHLTVRGVEQHLLTVIQSAHADASLASFAVSAVAFLASSIAPSPKTAPSDSRVTNSHLPSPSKS